MSDDSKKKINYVPVDGSTFAWYAYMSNKVGIETKDYFGFIANQVAIQHKSRGKIFDEPTPELQVYNILWRAEEMQRMKQRVAKLALIASQDPENEELADMLVSACKISGMVHDEVIKKAQNAIASAADFEIASTLLGDCVHWLEKLFDGQDQITSSSIEQMASTMGYDRNMLDRARKIIRLSEYNDYEIVSRKMWKGWAWIKVPKHHDDNTETMSMAPVSSTSDLSMI